MAQSEKAARQSAETAGNMAAANATDQLVRRASELADRLGRSGTRGGLIPTTPNLVPENAIYVSTNFDSNLFSSDQTELDDILTEPSLSPTLASQPDLLLSRVAEMAKRAHRAEASCHELTDNLEAEKHFSRLYKEACAEKMDLLKEQVGFFIN